MKNNLCLFFTSQSRNPASSDLPCSNILLANSICIYIQIIFKLANVFISKLRLHLQQTEIEYFTYAPNQPWPGFLASPDQDNQAWKNTRWWYVGGCRCQPGVESQSSDGLKTPAVHLFRKVELLFSEIKTTNKHTLYLSILVPPHDLCKKYTKKCVLSKKKIAKTGLNYACFMLKSTPARKKYSTAGCVVVTNINYAKLNQARSQDQGWEAPVLFYLIRQELCHLGKRKTSSKCDQQ